MSSSTSTTRSCPRKRRSSLLGSTSTPISNEIIPITTQTWRPCPVPTPAPSTNASQGPCPKPQRPSPAQIPPKIAANPPYSCSHQLSQTPAPSKSAACGPRRGGTCRTGGLEKGAGEVRGRRRAAGRRARAAVRGCALLLQGFGCRLLVVMRGLFSAGLRSACEAA